MIIIGVLYIFVTEEMYNWQGIWVLINVVAGYLILNNNRTLKRVREVWKGVLIPGVWAIAILNLFLVIISATIIAMLGTRGGGESSGNPFVSNILLVIVLFPIIPLFADAETHLFQRLILGKILKERYRNCPKCSKLTPPGINCVHCGKYVGGDKLSGPRVWTAVSVSALVFAGAHMLLLMSLAPILLTIGGFILGWLYLKRGHLFTARVHMVYNLVLILLLFLFYVYVEIEVIL